MNRQDWIDALERLLGAQHDFRIPEDLSPRARRVALAIVACIFEHSGPETTGGGCRLFYSRSAWMERGLEYGTDRNVLLVAVHDGGGAAPYFNGDYGDWELESAMARALDQVNAWSEPQTSWYTAIYPNY